MAGLLHATTGLFGGLNLRCKHNLRVSNGTAARLCMKTTAPNYHVEVRRLRAVLATRHAKLRTVLDVRAFIALTSASNAGCRQRRGAAGECSEALSARGHEHWPHI